MFRSLDASASNKVLTQTFAFLLLLCGPTLPLCAGTFRSLGSFTDLGGLLAYAIGPGSSAGQIYASYTYSGTGFDMVVIDPDTGQGQVYANPIPGVFGTWAVTVGPDRKIYMGTEPNAHLLRFDPVTKTFTDLGKPSSTEQYIWELVLGTDQKLYGGTYPEAKLIRLDPATGVMTDLGRMDPSQQYARHVAADQFGFVYAGIGSAAQRVVAYEIATGNHSNILPPTYTGTGFPQVYTAADGHVYGIVNGQHFQVSGFTFTPLTPAQAPVKIPINTLSDGRQVSLNGHTLLVTDPTNQMSVTHTLDYQGRPLSIFRLAIGPDGQLYGSTVLPAYLFRVDPISGSMQELATLGGGEAYSLVASGGRLLIGGYSLNAPLMAYDPAQSVSATNPKNLFFSGYDAGWRPTAMAAASDGTVYNGATGGYGKPTGLFTIWNTQTDSVTAIPSLMPNYSLSSLAVMNNGLIGGTDIRGGAGTVPSQTDAKIFLWDRTARTLLMQGVPMPGQTVITDLVPFGSKVYGLDGNAFFSFDPLSTQISNLGTVSVGALIYNSLTVRTDQQLWGLSAKGIFSINPQNGTAGIVDQAPAPITAGFGVTAQHIYYAANTDIMEYTPNQLAAVSPPVLVTDLNAVRVYPNPWRSTRGLSTVTFDQLPVNCTVKMFTLSGHWIKTLVAPNGTASWDLTNDSGKKVASGIYIYLVADGHGNKAHGSLAVIR